MDQEAINDFEELFASKGWKRLLLDAESEIEALQLNALENAKSFEEVCYMRGQSSQLLALLSLETMLMGVPDADL